MTSYVFYSERLGFRNWLPSDISAFHLLNSDPEVMRFFPSVMSRIESTEFMLRLSEHYEAKGYTYFAVDLLETNEFIGFIGLKDQQYVSPFTPATDLGWRIKSNFWRKGYATEGAKACIQFAKTNLDLSSLIAICPEINIASQKVMKKVNMLWKGAFLHPGLDPQSSLNPCICYAIDLAHG